MRLYHYTTIETLALILANRTIQFTRLDQLDDFHEVRIYASEITKQTFVSCWVGTTEESVPQWAMYGGNKRGVMIGLDHTYISFPEPVSIIEERGIEYMILKNMISNNEPFPIEYVSLEELHKRAKEKVKVNEVGGVCVFGQLGDLKSVYWEFQKEFRCSVSVTKHTKYLSRDTKDIVGVLNPEITHIYLPLKKGFQSDLDVVLGPLCTDEDRIKVETLLIEYDVANPLVDSSLKGFLRK